MPTIESNVWYVSKNGRAVTAKEQCQVLRLLYEILYTFGLMWQDVENASRAFESQRVLVAMCVLCMFDAVLRLDTSDSVVSNVFRREFYFSTNVGRSLRGTKIDIVSAELEFWNPKMCAARHDALRYLSYRETSCTFSIFNMSMRSSGSGPVVELDKMDSTMGFLRRVLVESKLSVIPKHPKPPSEMHALLGWLSCNIEKPFCNLDKKCPEFALTRDTATLVKFLVSMCSAQKESMMYAKERDEALQYRLSFQNDINRDSMKTKEGYYGCQPLRWEPKRVYGVSNSIGILSVSGFHNRRLFWGHGITIDSPTNVSRLLNVTHKNHHIEEQDVLVSTTLPRFNQALTEEQSETLISFLTVPYVVTRACVCVETHNHTNKILKVHENSARLLLLCGTKRITVRHSSIQHLSRRT